MANDCDLDWQAQAGCIFDHRDHALTAVELA